MERSFEMMEGLDAVKREALFRRWEVQDAIFLRRLEVETGVALGGRLPALDWGVDQLAGHEAGISIPSSSRARVDSRLT